MSRKLTDQNKTDIVIKYNEENWNCSDLGKEYNVSKYTIVGVLRKHGIEPPKEQRHKFVRKYTLNEHYFDTIDTEEKAYFLGLLYADGCNYEKGAIAQISLQERDVSVLEKFKTAIESNKPLRLSKKPKNGNQYVLELSSRHICEQLTNLGCVPRKSLILQFPTEEQVPSYLIRHFIRGYVDGDGCISIYKTKYTHMRVGTNVVSTLQFCDRLHVILKELLNIHSTICRSQCSVERNTSTRTISISGKNQVVIFLNWIYGSSTVSLDRKYQKYLEIISLPQNLIRTPKKTKELIYQDYVAGVSKKELANKYNCAIGTVRLIIRTYKKTNQEK